MGFTFWNEWQNIDFVIFIFFLDVFVLKLTMLLGNSLDQGSERTKDPHSPDQPISEQPHEVPHVEITWSILSDYIPPLIPVPHITSYPYNPIPSNGDGH